MKYTIHGLQQDKLLKNDLDNDDALILSVIKSMYSSASVDFEIIEDNRFIWVDQTRLLEQIPIVGSKRKLQRKLKKLEELGIINKKVLYSKLNQKGQSIKGTYSYVNVTSKLDDLSKRTEITENNNSPTPECRDPQCHSVADPTPECRDTQCHNDIDHMPECRNKDTLVIDTLVIDTLIEYFNKKEIIKCKKKTKTLEQTIIKKLKEFSKDEIIKAIDNYSVVINDTSYFFNTKWSLEKFLKQKNALPEFLEDGEKWINYNEFKKKEKFKNGNTGNWNSSTRQYFEEAGEGQKQSSAKRF